MKQAIEHRTESQPTIGNLIIVGLGNDLITDDGAGLYALRELTERVHNSCGKHNPLLQKIYNTITARELATGGLEILDAISGFNNCIIIDAVFTGTHQPGTIYRHIHHEGDEPVKLVCSHQIGLTEVLGLAKIFGLEIPSTIIIYGIEVSDVTTFGQYCTAQVQEAIPRLVDLILHDVMTGDFRESKLRDSVSEFPGRDHATEEYITGWYQTNTQDAEKLWQN